MKRLSLLLAAIALLLSPQFCLADDAEKETKYELGGDYKSEVKYTGRPISLDLNEAPIVDIFRLFHEIAGVDIVLDPAIGNRTITIDVDSVPWDQVLDMILHTHGLERVQKGKIIHIRLPDESFGRGIPWGPIEIEAQIFRGTRDSENGVQADILPGGGNMLVIDTGWVKDWRNRQQVLAESFGLEDVSLVAAPKLLLQPGDPGSIKVGREDGGNLYELALTAWPGGKTSGKVRVRAELGLNGVPFYETEVVATTNKPFLLGGRDDNSGEYVFLALTPRAGEGHGVAMTGDTIRVGTRGLENLVRVHAEAPVYPPALKKEGVEGLAVLDVIVNRDGEVSSVKILEADHPEMGQAASAAVRNWRYEPPVFKGKPTKVGMVVKVRFSLE